MTAAAPPTPGRASSREERVLHVAHLMSEGLWLKSPRFRRELASAWGVSESTVRDYSAEAHRLVAFDADSREQLRTTLAMRMEAIAEDALATCNDKTGLPDYGNAIRALESMAKFAGIEIEQKVKLSGAVALEDLHALASRMDESGEGGPETPQ